MFCPFCGCYIANGDPDEPIECDCGKIFEVAVDISWPDLAVILFVTRPTAVSNYDFVTVRAFHLVPPHVKTIRGYLCTDKNNNSEVLNEATNQVP